MLFGIIMDIDIQKIVAKHLATVLASEREGKRELRNYLLCKVAIERRHNRIAALKERGKSTEAEEAMLQHLVRSMAAHKLRINRLE